MPTVIIGTGGMGREALAWLADANPRASVLGFLDDDESRHGLELAGCRILGGSAWLEDHEADAVVAVGSPESRRKLVEKLKSLGVVCRTVVHPTAFVGPRVTVGAGSIICPNATISADVEVGDAVIVNFGAQVGHDCRIGSYAFVGPGVNLAGNVTVGEGAEIGIGATAIQGTTIGAWARVGAGAVVVRDIPPGVTAVGVPAEPMEPGAEEQAR